MFDIVDEVWAKYNVGDLVRVRSFDDIANDPHNTGSYDMPILQDISFPSNIKELCGEIFEVARSDGNGTYRLKRDSGTLRWIFADEFLEPAEIKELAGFSDDEIQVLLGGGN